MKKIRKKRCVICNELFTPRTPFQKACSIEHAIQYSRLKKAAEKSELNKMRNEKLKSEKLSELIRQTQAIVNRYIRLRDQGKTCISCGFPLGHSFDAGHIFSVKQHNMIRFDENVIYGQCVKCNRHEEGNYELARMNAEKRIGSEEFKKVKERADVALRVPFTWSRYDLRKIQKTFRDKYKDLENERKHH